MLKAAYPQFRCQFGAYSGEVASTATHHSKTASCTCYQSSLIALKIKRKSFLYRSGIQRTKNISLNVYNEKCNRSQWKAKGKGVALLPRVFCCELWACVEVLGGFKEMLTTCDVPCYILFRITRSAEVDWCQPYLHMMHTCSQFSVNSPKIHLEEVFFSLKGSGLGKPTMQVLTQRYILIISICMIGVESCERQGRSRGLDNEIGHYFQWRMKGYYFVLGQPTQTLPQTRAGVWNLPLPASILGSPWTPIKNLRKLLGC